MRRSSHTVYAWLDTQVYEYRQHYFVLQMCQQGEELNPLHGPGQLASDFCALSAKLPVDACAAAIGSAAEKALDDFDTIGHAFGKFDIPARNKQIASWFGARGMGSLVKNCRVVQITQDIASGVVRVIPFDNHHRDNWHGPMDDKTLQAGRADAHALGQAVQAAFLVATHHPERKDPV